MLSHLAVGIMIELTAAVGRWTVSIAGLVIAAVAVAMLPNLSVPPLSYHWSLPFGPVYILVAGVAHGVPPELGPSGDLVAQLSPRGHFET